MHFEKSIVKNNTASVCTSHNQCEIPSITRIRINNIVETSAKWVIVVIFNFETMPQTDAHGERE